jgi:hypothetical protein
MKILTKTISIIAIITIFSSCASIVSKTSWPLTVRTDPTGARVEITDIHGFIVYSGNTPATMSLKSGGGFFTKQSYKVKFTMDGYDARIIPIECSLNGWYIGNIVFGGLIGLLIVDPATGAMYKLDREYINETLTKTNSSSEQSLRIIDIKDLPESMKEHLDYIE